MFDLKVINSVVQQLEEERGIPREKTLEAIAMSLATAYKKEYGKKGQIVRASFDQNTGGVEFWQVKVVVDRNQVIMEGDEEEEIDLKEANVDDIKIRFNPEQHMLIEDAKKIKKNAEIGEELVFPLEMKADFGRIAAQTAKQIIIQKIREAEKVSVMSEYGAKEGEIVAGTVERVERGIVHINMGRAVGMIAYEEQIPSERWKTGDRIRAYLYAVEETPKGIVLKLSRAHPKFLAKLFETEAPEIASGTVEIKGIAREAGSRSKIAVVSHDPHIDPIGSMVGQRGVRVSTVTSELSGEKIDIIEWNEDPALFIEEALSPAEVISIELDEKAHRAIVTVTEDEQSLAIGKGGQNVRLAAKLTGWKIDIKSAGDEGDDEGEENEEEVAAESVETKNAETDEKVEKVQASKEEVKETSAKENKEKTTE
ncbi:MAG: transcription termination factor NusA [Candidatus Taylorbacteria bacterium RIFCSPHIGHO2_02_FULL_45_28]|uniref:Transcription termination/antitermination protein NusA n=1 Tax=Candidatus Taylorbacteria bacterium RIFCSPHIGHO2_12_FULL_45_16 TaxID=1802315 RepID=A0A1G2N3E6_9BACT|nr:MAG: transcription termination factor NusA [Candidatus Taylorbacteria bacterium RIFCSPHIGHO2_01_FULL_44_110]OHA24963.1 MAG: transcription termination factor NusA [Candidatus Taylorbacteria bacterium RIFCSPHIGHO2_02_FULL_45_28]OHA29781.1 MAG: transcription termination factor NusA [Candidatus Taylorbacteria bacterium RIFCSPHIGHO2_12_FULL_45_16]OHA32725.1 MAG: transcription termination factor NusA [Candidatus Taylorbacteria bacterium RIFCSPLOWO2_01_FULL_45_59]OHA39019.1 MAG: transcription termi